MTVAEQATVDQVANSILPQHLYTFNTRQKSKLDIVGFDLPNSSFVCVSPPRLILIFIEYKELAK